MKVAGGRIENGIVIGNTFDKYGSRNPIVRLMMTGFNKSLDRFVRKARPKTVHEIGCGEGYWVSRWLAEGIDARGSDFSTKVIAMAGMQGLRHGIDPSRFQVRSIYDVKPGRDSADLIVCCEVLEHLENPEAALNALNALNGKDLIVSVPREPLWRVLNMARGKYVMDLGNTPGHIQHWSKSGIIRLVSKYFDIEEVATPLPWTMMHCRWKR